MRFKDFFYEATIKHDPSKLDRVVYKRPTTIPLPEDLKGKRLVTIINTDDNYQTFVFDPKCKSPHAVLTGGYENPHTGSENDSNIVGFLWGKVTKPYVQGSVDTYKGEPRIHPPFQGYKEFPKDVNEYFFTDFENEESVYRAGENIFDKYEQLK